MGRMEDFEVRLQRQIDQLEAENRRLTDEIAVLRGRLSGLRDALRLYRGEAPALPQRRSRKSGPSGSRVPDPGRSPGWAFILDLLGSAPPQGYSVDYLVERSSEHEHSIQRNSLRSILSHAAKEGVVERVSMGHYRLAHKTEPPDEPPPGGTENSLGDAGLPGELPRQDLPDGSTPSSSTPRQDLLSSTAFPGHPHITAGRS